MVVLCFHFESLSVPRIHSIAVSLTMKLEANMEAVILRQSLQWHMKVSTRSSPSVGYVLEEKLVFFDCIMQFDDVFTYE